MTPLERLIERLREAAGSEFIQDRRRTVPAECRCCGIAPGDTHGEHCTWLLMTLAAAALAHGRPQEEPCVEVPVSAEVYQRTAAQELADPPRFPKLRTPLQGQYERWTAEELADVKRRAAIRKRELDGEDEPPKEKRCEE